MILSVGLFKVLQMRYFLNLYSKESIEIPQVKIEIHKLDVQITASIL